MSVRQTILRYIHVVNKLRKGPASFNEIDEYLTQQSIWQDEKFNVSKRQFHRDLKVIDSIFEIDIFYDASNGVYRINDDEISEISKRRMEAFDTFNALRIEKNTSDFIHFENRKPLGTENLFGLVHAIKNRLNIRFSYQKYWEDEMTQRRVEPYALKEFKSRWYVLAKDNKDNNIKSFALDRLTNLEITNKSFIYPGNYNIEESYRYCFGIISPSDQTPEEIILSFDPIQGKYIKSLPIHHSQQVLIDTETELRIQLKIYVTYDLVMELLSFGENVKVIQPPSLMEEISTGHKNAYKR